jgi:hypothetical protein
MRLLSPLVTALTAVSLIVAQVAARTTPAPDTGGSLLAPRPGEPPPPPTPIAPPRPMQGAMPATSQSVVPPQRGPDAVTAEPLPPPTAVPPPAPVVAVPAAPTPLTPIPLSLPPRPTTPVVERHAAPATPPPASNSGIVPTLPVPALSSEASPADFLRAARGAVAAGRGGEARSSLEMAQTRLLSREVDAGKESEPSQSAAVKQISDALAALAANDRMTCLHDIEAASETIGSPLD